MAEGVFAMISC